MRAALRNPDFRRLFLGRLVTNAGDSIYMVAAMWLVYELTGSPAYTGLAGFLVRIPMLFQALAGPLVDRWSLRRVLVGTQVIQATLVLAVPLAWWADALTVELVLVVMPLLSLLNQFVYPAQAAAVPRLVEKDDLVGANSALSLAYQGTDLVFNALAGVLVAAVGAVALYLVDSATFVLAALLFVSIRLPPAESAEDETGQRSVAATATDGGESASVVQSYVADLRAGFDYVRGTILLAFLGAPVVANATFGAAFSVLPAFADIRGGPELYGALTAAVAAGGLLGALLASRLDDQPYGRLAIVGFGAGGICWLAAAATTWRPATVVLFGLAFVPVGVTNVIAGSMVQSLVPEELLGRVSAVVSSAATAAAPFGALGGGLLAAEFGAVAVVAAAAGGFLFIAAYTAALPELRRMPAVGEMETLDRA